MEIALETSATQNEQLTLLTLIRGYLFHGLELIIMESICYRIPKGYLGLRSIPLEIFITRLLVLLLVDFYADVLWIKDFQFINYDNCFEDFTKSIRRTNFKLLCFGR